MNYYLPETDRTANDVNPLLDMIAEMPSQGADMVEVGAISVIGMLGDSATDLRDQTVAQAANVGVSKEEAEATFGVVFDALMSILQPRLDSLRDAVRVAQAPDAEAEVNVDELIRLILAGV